MTRVMSVCHDRTIRSAISFEVIREDFRGADGASDGQGLNFLLLGQLHAPLNIADGIQILIDLGAVRFRRPLRAAA